jgi:phage shock protein PspC (stress-responsive transcriptional regulator)
LPGALAGLRRSSSDRKIAGIAGGIGRRYDIEPWLVRVGLIVLAIFGVGVALYIVAWLLLPTDVAPSIAERRGWSRNTAIAIAIIGGVVILAGGLGGPFRRHPDWVLPWLLVGFGLWLMLRSADSKPTTAVVTTPEPGAEPDLDAPLSFTSSTPPIDPTRVAPVPVVPPPPRPPRPRSFLTPITLCVLAIFTGIAIALPRHTWNSPAVGFALALAFIGAVLLLSAWRGRARGLILVGLLLVPPFLITQTVGGRWNDWRGSVVERPRTASAVQDSYEWGIGQRTLDLTGVDLSESDHLSVSVDQSIGALRLILPPDAVSHVQSHVGAGDIQYRTFDANAPLKPVPPVAPGKTSTPTPTMPPKPPLMETDGPPEENGFGADSTTTITTGTGASTIDIDLHLGIGQIRVTANDVTEVTR